MLSIVSSPTVGSNVVSDNNVTDRQDQTRDVSLKPLPQFVYNLEVTSSCDAKKYNYILGMPQTNNLEFCQQDQGLVINHNLQDLVLNAVLSIVNSFVPLQTLIKDTKELLCCIIPFCEGSKDKISINCLLVHNSCKEDEDVLLEFQSLGITDHSRHPKGVTWRGQVK